MSFLHMGVLLRYANLGFVSRGTKPRFRNRVNRELKKSKKSYYVTYFVEHCNNIKKNWEGIRSIVNINHRPLDRTLRV